MKFIPKTNNNTSQKDEWCTPKILFDALNNHYDFTLDACATKENTHCKKFYTKKDDALKKDWCNEKVFINPPYSKTKEFVEKAIEEKYLGAKIIVMVLNANTDTRWFCDLFLHCSCILFITGRISFLEPNGKPKGAPTKGQCIAIFDKKLAGTGIVRMASKQAIFNNKNVFEHLKYDVCYI